VLAKADPLNDAGFLPTPFLVGYRSGRGPSLLEPGTLVLNGVFAHATPSVRDAG
jgi:hypothetical protein